MHEPRAVTMYIRTTYTDEDPIVIILTKLRLIFIFYFVFFNKLCVCVGC
jgi:hypothetical protein